MSGVTKASQGADIDANAVGVGRHTPVVGGWSNVMAALRPSPTRCAMSVSAASSPNATPLVLAGPSGIAESDTASAASSVAVAYGE